MSRAWRELEAEHARLGHAKVLLEGCRRRWMRWMKANSRWSASSSASLRGLPNWLAIDPSLQEFQELLSSAAIQADEAVYGLRRYRDRVEADPGTSCRHRARIAAVTDMARKHRVSPRNWRMCSLAERRAAGRLGCRRPTRSPLQEKAEAAQRAYATLATALSAARAPVAKALSEQVTAAMQTLAMTGGRLKSFGSRRRGQRAWQRSRGFQVAANPSQPAAALAKVASGASCRVSGWQFR